MRVQPLSLAALSALVLLVVLASWHILMLPTSMTEYAFRKRISALRAAMPDQIDLSSLMQSPGWELVCESHGYDEDLYLKKYNRAYSPAAPAQDGAWGLIFIDPDGSHKAVAWNCRQVGFGIRVGGCAERTQTVLKLKYADSSCPVYARE